MLTNLPEIFTLFEDLTDPRADSPNKQHKLVDIIFIALCATIAGCNTYNEIELFARDRFKWFAKYLELPGGIPSHDTIRRVLLALDTHQFQVCLNKWIEHLRLDLDGCGVHIDGKTLRGSFDSASNKKALHMVSAWCSEHSVCLGQVATDKKSNEITAVPMLLELLNIKGAVVTLDAMHCQRQTVAKIRDKEAHYLVTVKANQGNLHETIRSEFEKYGEDNYQSPKCRTYRNKIQSRGRIEERIVTVAAAPRWLKETGDWADIKTIGMVYRHREEAPDSCCRKPLEETERVTFFISSLPLAAKKIAKYVRDHWSVENSLHWTLDVTFSEDKSRIRAGNAPEVLAIMRRIALTLIKRDTLLFDASLRVKKAQASWSTDSLEAVLTGKKP